jgi:diguanylate cyclase (GGDEF)-like protein
VVALLEIGIFVNGYTRPQGAAWILPAYIIVPIASSPIWLFRRDFILAMLVCCLFGPLPVLWLMHVDSWELLQYTTYMVVAAVVSSVLYGHLVQLVSDHYQLEQRLRQLAFVDGLTGLASRPRFLEQARALLEASRVTGGALAALYLDADHFKRLNDQHSHAAGDVALGIIGDTLRQHLRPGDVVGRIGGEEFAILLPGADEESACATAERLRAAVAASRGAAMALSISVGVAVRRDDATLEALLARADAALTAAKRNGRNRVERAP